MRHFTQLFFVFLFLIFSSCSDESIQDITAEDLNTDSRDFLKSNELFTSNFLPTFTNYYGRDRGTSTYRSSSLASEWIHEYDDKNRLVKSSFFELFPYRILKEITFLDFEEDHKLKYEIKQYSYYGLYFSFTNTHELTYDDNLNITTIGDAGTVLKELNDEGWVTKIDAVTPDGHIVYQTGYEYDERGNILKYISYYTPVVGSAAVDYTYNEKGDPLSYYFQNSHGAETRAQYYYREDNTLERLEEVFNNGDGDFGTKIFTYSLEERYLQQIQNNRNGSKEIATYKENEILVEHFRDENTLSEAYIYGIRGHTYYLKLHKEYLNGAIHLIKYYNIGGDLEYTEYYDDNGNLTETVYE